MVPPFDEVHVTVESVTGEPPSKNCVHCTVAWPMAGDAETLIGGSGSRGGPNRIVRNAWSEVAELLLVETRIRHLRQSTNPLFNELSLGARQLN